MKSIFKLVFLFVFILPVFGHAATYTWDGGGGDNNWTTCANWSSNTCPLSTDDVIFSGTSVKNASIDTNITVVNFSINAGYTGVISTAGSNTITINGSLAQSAGTFTVSSATTSVAGNFTFSSGTFNHNNGTMYFITGGYATTLSPGSAIFNNVTMDTNGGFNYDTYLATDMNIQGNLIVLYNANTYGRTYRSDSSTATRTISVAGNLSFPSTASNGSISFGYSVGNYPLLIDLKGSLSVDDPQVLVCADFVFSSSSNQTISKSAGTVYNTSDWMDTGSGDFILTSNFAGDMRLRPDSATDFNFVPTPYTFTVLDVSILGGGTFAPVGPSSYIFSYLNLSTGTFNAHASSSIGNFNQTGGVFNAVAGTTSFVGNFTYTSGTFNHNNGTTYLSTNGYNAGYTFGGVQLNNVVFDTLGGFGYTTSINSDMNIGGNLIVRNSNNSYDRTYRSDNASATRTISIAGNLLFPSTPGTSPTSFGYSVGNYPLLIDLKGNMQVDDSQMLICADFVFSSSSSQTLSKSAGTIYSTSDWMDTGSGDFILTSNFAGDMRLRPDSATDFNFVPTPYTFTVLDVSILGGGSFTPAGPSSYIFSYLNLSTGTFNASASSSIGSFSQTGGVFNAAAGTTTFTSNFVISGGTFNHNNGTVYFPATLNGVTYSAGSAVLNNVVIDKVAGNNLTQTFSGDMIIDGNLSISNSAPSLSLDLQSNNSTPRTITIGGNLTFPSTAGTGAMSIGRFDNSLPIIFNLKGNLSIADSQIAFFSAVQFTGTGTQTISNTAGTIWTPSPWLVNKTNGSVNLLTNISHGGTFSIATGTLSTKGFNLSGMTGFTVGASGTLALFGGETVTAPTFATGSTALYEGTSTTYTLKNWGYKNLTLQGAGGTTFNLPAALNVAQNLNIATGTLDVTASNFALGVGKNWNNTGTFTPRSGTVTLNGTLQTITGTSTFYNLTKSVTSADTLTFGANQTQTVTNTWTANGTSGNVLSLRSTTPGVQWRINPQATRTLSYIDTQDSNNSNGTIIATDSTITSAGNNTNWNFDTTAPVVSSIASTPGASTSTIVWSTNETATSTIQYGLTTSYGSASTSLATSSHSVVLSGLTSNTTYHYRIIATDAAGNTSTSSDQTFNTLDITAPVISSINATPGSNSAAVTWNTDEAATSSVQYGLTTSYGTASTSLAASSHSVTLAGLTANTVYHYRIIATDASGNISTSSDQTFTTLDVSAPTTSSIVSTPGASTSTISWSTDEAATSTVQYGLTTSYGSASTSLATSSHSVSLSGLISGSVYHYRIIATDDSGNTSTSSDQTFNTLDVTSPVISFTSPETSYVKTINQTAAQLLWTTNENASSSVYYGLTSSYGAVATSSGNTSHTVNLSSLTPSTVYHYMILARDASGNISTTTDATFTTSAVPNTEVIIPQRFGSESAPIYGCTDTRAINYNQFRAHLQSLCEYVTTTVVKPTTPTSPSAPSASQKFIFTKDLQSGMKNSDVKELQKFLNKNGFTISTTGAGSIGKETDLFGPATKNAVMKFQKAKKISPVNGRFGPMTRKNANAL